MFDEKRIVSFPDSYFAMGVSGAQRPRVCGSAGRPERFLQRARLPIPALSWVSLRDRDHDYDNCSLARRRHSVIATAAGTDTGNVTNRTLPATAPATHPRQTLQSPTAHDAARSARAHPVSNGAIVKALPAASTPIQTPAIPPTQRAALVMATPAATAHAFAQAAGRAERIAGIGEAMWGERRRTRNAPACSSGFRGALLSGGLAPPQRGHSQQGD
jgi:hypothetical protein